MPNRERLGTILLQISAHFYSRNATEGVPYRIITTLEYLPGFLAANNRADNRCPYRGGEPSYTACRRLNDRLKRTRTATSDFPSFSAISFVGRFSE